MPQTAVVVVWKFLPSSERLFSGEEGPSHPMDALIDPQHDDRRCEAGLGCTFPSSSGVGRNLVLPRSPPITLLLEAREFRRYGRWMFATEFT